MLKFRTIICTVLAVMLVVSCFSGCSREKKKELDVKKIVFSEEQLSEIRREMDEIINSEIFYGGVSVMLNENEVYKGYFGQSNKKGDPVTEDTQYMVNSATKVFTAVAIIQLAENNKLSLDDTLGKYYDSEKYPYLDEVTIENLLDVSVSFGNYRYELKSNKKAWDKLVKKAKSKKKKAGKQVREMIEEHILRRGIDEQNVQISNYYLLGKIIEEASGMDYEEYLRKNIFYVIGLNNTDFVNSDQKGVGYNRKKDKWVKQADKELFGNYDYLYSGYGVISTLDDMGKFYKAIVDNKLCQTDIVKKAIRQGEGFYCGFETDGKKLYVRSGLNIHRVYSCINPDTEEIVNVLTCTVGGESLTPLGRKIYSKVNAKVNRVLLESYD
ncbi:MAG: beta-lactamase family protein [Ruminococcus sp.]|nr:beta-lactamase family protein [Ruminococcus sp.]